MNKDPILSEVRKTRLEIEKECEQRGESFGDFILRTQSKSNVKLIFRNPLGRKRKTREPKS